jgi:hypothetical protein
LLLIEKAADGTHGALLGYVTRDPMERDTPHPLFPTACLYHALVITSPIGNEAKP